MARSEESKAISLRELWGVLSGASAKSSDGYQLLRDRWFDALLGRELDELPSMHHVAYVRRLSPLEHTYTKERATEICLQSLRELGEELLTEATRVRYRGDHYLSDMDAGFYSADYLRAWIRSAQLRDYLKRGIGEDWWRDPKTGELLGSLFAEGTKPTSEEIAGRLGYDPLDVEPLSAEFGASR